MCVFWKNARFFPLLFGKRILCNNEAAHFIARQLLAEEVKQLKKKRIGTKWLRFLYILIPIQIVLFAISVIFYLIVLFKPSAFIALDSHFALFAALCDVFRFAIKRVVIKNKSSSSGYKPLIASIVLDLASAVIVSIYQDKHTQSQFLYYALIVFIAIAIAVPNIVYVLKRRFIYRDGLIEIALSDMWYSYYEKKYNNNERKNTQDGSSHKTTDQHNDPINNLGDESLLPPHRNTSIVSFTNEDEKDLIVTEPAPTVSDNFGNTMIIKNPIHEETSLIQDSIASSTNNNGTTITIPEICFCRKCGKKLTPDSLFCNYCGTEIIKEVTDDEV